MEPELIRKSLIDIMQAISPDNDYSSIKDDAPLREQFDLDSMDFLDIVLELRRQYSIDVPESDYEHLQTMNSSITYLGSKMP